MLHSEKRKAWGARVTDYRRSKLSAREWCKEHGVGERQLRYWLKRSEEAAETTRWTGVQITPEPAPSASGITIHLGVARIEVNPGFDHILLREVLSVVVASC